MDRETFIGLSIARIFRSGELLVEANDLLKQGRYKSANNRAFYCVEKLMQSLLASKEINSDSHIGCLKQFNIHFINKEVGNFQKGDYKEIASIARIRNNSDYDDFYIADKKECKKVVESAYKFYVKTLDYFENFEEYADSIEELRKYCKSIE